MTDEDLLARVARAFLDANEARGKSRALLEAPSDYLPSFWKEMAELGWMGLHIDEAHGGQGFGLPELSVVLEALTQQLLHRLNELAADVNLFMNSGRAAGGEGFGGEFNYTPAQDEDTEHLRFDVRSDGRLEIRGTRAFWGCFSFEIASPQYQFGFFGDTGERRQRFQAAPVSERAPIDRCVNV
mgnify:CR=1 FL=1